MWNLSPAALKTRRSGKLIFLTVKVRKGKKVLLYKTFQQQVIQHSQFHTCQHLPNASLA